MRVNVYAEELTDKVEVVGKRIGSEKFTGIRLLLELPATVSGEHHRGPLAHRPGDDHSAAITLWDKGDCNKLRKTLEAMMKALDEHASH